MTLPTTMKYLGAFLPVGMSLAALSVVIIHIARFGVTHEADEGTSAHLWQLLMVAQVPIMGFVAITQLSESPRRAIPVLALQVVAALAALAPVYFLNL
jgi:hypothetical protein